MGSGCTYAGLSIETASETMLERMHRGYRVDDIKEALENLSKSGIPFGLSILLGAPGETPETISETFHLVDRYAEKALSIWVSIGISLWTRHQQVIDIARTAIGAKRPRDRGCQRDGGAATERQTVRQVDHSAARASP